MGCIVIRNAAQDADCIPYPPTTEGEWIPVYDAAAGTWYWWRKP